MDGVDSLRPAEPLRIDRPTRLIGGDFIAPDGSPLFEITSSRVELVGVRTRIGCFGIPPSGGFEANR